MMLTRVLSSDSGKLMNTYTKYIHTIFIALAIITAIGLTLCMLSYYSCVSMHIGFIGYVLAQTASAGMVASYVIRSQKIKKIPESEPIS